MSLPIERGKISASQFMFAVMCYLQGTTIVTSFYSSDTKQDAWFTLITGFLLCLLFIWMYVYILNKYPGKNWIEIIELVFGQIIGKIISLLYLFFFIMVSALNLNNVSDFVCIHLMPETPEIVFSFLMVFLCAFIVFYGVETIVRYGMVFFILWIIGLAIATTLSAFNMNLNNFLPMLSFPLNTYIRGTLTASTMPFLSIFVLTMIAPYTDNKKLIGKAFFMGAFLGFIPLLVMTLRDIAVLGSMSAVIELPSFETLRQINVVELFSRMEVLFAILRLMMMFFKIGIIVYAACLCGAQLFGVKSYKFLILILSAIILMTASILFDSPIEEMAWGSTTAPIFNAFFEMLLPLIMLITIKVKDWVKQAKEVNL